MNKLSELEEIKLQDKENVDAWYEEMNQQFKEDSKTHDFSLSKEWDEDFQKAMFGTAEKKGRDRRVYKKVLYAAAGVVLFLIVGLGVTQNEVIGDSLDKIFKNESDVLDSEVDHFGTKEEMITGKNEEDEKFSFADKTLTEVYEQVKNALKRPIFQMQDNLGKYEIENAVYDDKFNVVVIQFVTDEGRIFISQRDILDNSVVGTKHDANSVVVWNENLQQEIVINKSIQDESYMFSVQNDYVVFNFNGYVSAQTCVNIAKNLSYE